MSSAIARPRCYPHRDRRVFPAGCHTCQRIRLERRIVTRVVDALLAADYALQVWDGEEHRPGLPTCDRTVILTELMQTDEDWLLAFPAKGSTTRRWVRFVYGNDGWDVISDYTVGLETVLAPVNAYVDTLN